MPASETKLWHLPVVSLTAPSYQNALIQVYNPCHQLHSANKLHLVVLTPHRKKMTPSKVCFRLVAPQFEPPASAHSAAFQYSNKLLETELFSIFSYGMNVIIKNNPFISSIWHLCITTLKRFFLLWLGVSAFCLWIEASAKLLKINVNVECNNSEVEGTEAPVGESHFACHNQPSKWSKIFYRS